ncbi:LysR family transcriptional regulator [Peribacillus kribbensis]|uniref:LysR family transcriptional regulator n=1 Tax=Peribacillus kribbensis TaxID=356658 RepID=UPI0004148535|nr:LysR family transcriptional regulator [Peribacillus kribbensis]
MDLRQLRYFIVLAEEGQISRAAKKLNMSQPPLSQQLQMMEEELGVTLLERKKHGRSMKLTEPGRVLYEKARSLLQNFEDSMHEVKETGEGVRGNLLIGSVLAYVSYLPQKIKMFKEKNPSVEIKLFAGDPTLVQDYLEKQDIELAIVYLPVELEGLSIKKLDQVPNVFVVPESWGEFQSTEKIKLEEIGNSPLVMLHRTKGTGIFDEIIKEFSERGIEPNVLCKCPDVNVLLSLVSAGIGASIVPKSAVPPYMSHKVRVLEIKDSLVHSNVALVWKKERYLSKATQQFIELF